ncbi:MAG: leucine-rich repeat domain-containing protein, partial [Candidatus Hodarchaeales archaeon]
MNSIKDETCYPLLENFEICVYEEKGNAKLLIRNTYSREEKIFDCVHSVTTITPDEFEDWGKKVQEKALENLRMVTNQSSLGCDIRMFGARSYAEGLSELFRYSNMSEVFQALIDTDLQTIGTDYPLNSEIAKFIAQHDQKYEDQYIEYLKNTLRDDDGNLLCKTIFASLDKFYGNDEFSKKQSSYEIGCFDEFYCIHRIENEDDLKRCANMASRNVKQVIINSAEITELPENIGNLGALEHLELINNKITELPESIGNLSLLTKLYLSINQLNELPESFSNLQSLTSILLNKNQFRKIPDSIFEIGSLEWINLGNNSINELPEKISNLERLEDLFLYENDLLSLPESIGSVNSLEKLFLHQNRIDKLPESIGNLKSLHTLNLSYNKLKKIPESIGNLQSLEELHLRENYLFQLPESITKLNSLLNLNVEDNL